jgi:hypothetical protein
MGAAPPHLKQKIYFLFFSVEHPSFDNILFMERRKQ